MEDSKESEFIDGRMVLLMTESLEKVEGKGEEPGCPVGVRKLTSTKDTTKMI